MPQPNLVPVSLRCSRSTHNSGVLGSTPTSCALPLTVKATIAVSSLAGVIPAGNVYLVLLKSRPAQSHYRAKMRRLTGRLRDREPAADWTCTGGCLQICWAAEGSQSGLLQQKD